jgi:Lsr2
LRDRDCLVSYADLLDTGAGPSARCSRALGYRWRIHDRFPYDCVSQAKEGVMARRVEVVLEDDIDGGHADETVRFAYDGNSYEIDLSGENAQALRSALARYIEHARKASALSRPARSARNRVDNPAVRAWAKAQGIEINERGRIPASVIKEYRAAQRS